MPPIPSREREIALARVIGHHWRPGWRSTTVFEGGYPVRIGFGECKYPCCRPDLGCWVMDKP
jgi:hypothetical protein